MNNDAESNGKINHDDDNVNQNEKNTPKYDETGKTEERIKFYQILILKSVSKDIYNIMDYNLIVC